MVHISDLRSFRFCPRIYWLSTRERRQAYHSFISMVAPMHQMLIKKLGIENYFSGRQGMDAQDSLKAIHANEWCFNLRFEAKGLRVKVPGIHQTGDAFDLYFTSMGTWPKIEDASYYANHFWVLSELGIKIHKMYIMTFNKDYVRQDELDIDRCFNISSDFVKQGGHVQGDVYNIVSKKHKDYTDILISMEATRVRDDFPITLEKCPNPIKCDHFNTCFPDMHFPDDSIYHFSAKDRKAWIEEGKTSITEVPVEELMLSKAQYAQIMAAHLGGRFVDQRALNHWLDKFEGKTLSFVDFEWDTFGIPPYPQMRPLDVVCFQYSLHTIEDGLIHHREFLGQGDCREEFIVSLLNHLPADGPLFAYNAFGAEAIRLRQLAEQFPQYQTALQAVIDRFVDLALIFIDGIVYDAKMKGAYSLKRIIEAVNPELSYEKLAISHGLDAVYHYRNLSDDEEQDEAREALLSYCRMDTLAMVKVYQWLKTLG